MSDALQAFYGNPQDTISERARKNPAIRVVTHTRFIVLGFLPEKTEQPSFSHKQKPISL
ncbi:MAG: hypothetical protein LBJ59_07875 [Zoogloeaceae bacterium]|jgi:hypothetical protein|nr:hypothetical protein [Zoogloeaceae bacterium]